MSIYLVNNIIIPLDAQPDFRREVMNALRCKGRDLLSVDIYRKAWMHAKRTISCSITP